MTTSAGRIGAGLLTDLYQLTMGCGYLASGMQDSEAVFTLSFRSMPFRSGFAICCGLEDAIRHIECLHFGEDDLTYLAGLKGASGGRLLDAGLLEYLRTMRWAISVDAMPEGTAVFAHEPLVRVQGPLIQCQLLETALLNTVNFQTLVATKAARIHLAAGGEPVLEFGLRRAQGPDGGLTASRAAHVGGCSATSNLLAGKELGIPVAGTHAHSWVMCFDSELEAFEAYARAMPDNCIFLVDTYDSLQGVHHAVQVGRALRSTGHRLLGIRLDSGDLAWLSSQARKLLDAAGLQDAFIVASNDLDEHLIESLKNQGASIGVWGVGTRLVTAFEEPALGGVYKLTAMRRPGGAWQDKLKLSERISKTSTPGVLQARRFRSGGLNVADAIYDEKHPLPRDWTIVDANDAMRTRRIESGAEHEDLLVPVIRQGRRVYDSPPLGEMRKRTLRELGYLHPSIKRFANPHEYPVGLEKGLAERRLEMIMRHKGEVAAARGRDA